MDDAKVIRLIDAAITISEGQEALTKVVTEQFGALVATLAEVTPQLDEKTAADVYATIRAARTWLLDLQTTHRHAAAYRTLLLEQKAILTEET